jgi:hypothetical protein
MMKPNRLKRDAGQRQERQHRDRMQDLEIDEELRRCQDHQSDQQRLGRRRADIAEYDFDERHRCGQQLVDRAEELSENRSRTRRWKSLCVSTESMISPGTMKAP